MLFVLTQEEYELVCELLLDNSGDFMTDALYAEQTTLYENLSKQYEEQIYKRSKPDDGIETYP